MTEIWFPQLSARDLDGRQVVLLAGLPGEWNVIIVAFRRQQQDLVDSWAPWLEEQEAAIPGLGFAEVPAIGSAVATRAAGHRRRDGGGHPRPADAAAHPDRLCRPAAVDGPAGHRRPGHDLAIPDEPGRAGALAWLGRLGRGHRRRPRRLLAEPPQPAEAATQPAGPGAEQFEMAFDPHFRLPLAALGITPATAHVTVTPSRLVACFGPWTCHTDPANVRAVRLTGPYRRHRAIGPRLSLADHGLTFGTTTDRGVCLLLREPVPGIDPLGLIRHPGLTLTVADPRRFAATVRRYADLPPGADPAPAHE